jgi:CDP-diacylglycerol--serine O-phosphatidyltransferase
VKNRRKRQRIKKRGVPVPVKAIIPNLVTSIAACAGITSIALSAEGSFVKALFALLVACICDGMDGRVARMLNASSKLGAELDSLADFVNFGVAPALFMFFWLTGGPDHVGVASGTVKIILGCSLFYALCDCFRLARFNTMLEQPSLPYWKHFFTGVPAPGGCWMVLTPAILAIALDAKGKLPELQAVLQHPILGGAMLLFVGSLMASRLPTISLKALHFTSKRQMRIFMAIALLLIALLVSNLWLTLGIIGMLYIFTIPVTCKIFIKEKNKYLARTQEES